MKKIILAMLFSPSLSFAIGAGGINLSPNPRFLLISSNTFLYTNTFLSSVTFVDGRMMINGQAYTWPNSITGGNCLQVDGSGVLSWATCGSGGEGGGGGSLFAEPYGVTISTLFFPRSDFLLLNGVGAEETGISTITWRGSTGSVTTPWLFRSSTTFQGFVKISTLASHEGFGIAQSSGLEVGGVQFTVYMTTITTAIDFFKTINGTSNVVMQNVSATFSTITIRLNAVGVDTTTLYNLIAATAIAFKPDNMGSHVATKTITLENFAIHKTSGVYGGQSIFEGSGTWKGIIVSSAGGLFGGTTIQGTLVVEGGSITISNPGATPFTLDFASGSYAAGDHLIVSQVAGNRFVIASGKDNSGAAGASPITGSDWNIKNSTDMTYAVAQDSTTRALSDRVDVATAAIREAFQVHTSTDDVMQGVQNSTITNIEKAMGVYNSTTPYTTISIPAAAWWGVSPSSASKVNGGFVMTSTGTSAFNIPGDSYHLFDPPASTATFAITSFRMPFEWDGGTIAFQVSWHASSGARTNVGWSLGAVAISSGDSVWQSFTSSVTVFSTFASSFTEILSPMSAAVTVGNSPAPGDRVKLRLSAGGANFAGFPRMTEVLIWYRKAVLDGRLR